MDRRNILLVLLAISVSLVVLRACEFTAGRFEGERRAAPASEVHPMPPHPPQPPPMPAIPSVAMPDFKVVGEDLYDGPEKAQVKQRIVVPDGLSEEKLHALLAQQYEKALHASTFQHFGAPTDVTIYAYDSREEATEGSDHWVARLQMANRGRVDIDIRNN